MVSAQQPLLTLAMGLRRRLSGLGVLSSSDAARLLADYSVRLVDALPKQWAAAGAHA